MAKFSYNDIVTARAGVSASPRRDTAWAVGIFESHLGLYFDKFPKGFVYTIEYEDGSSEQIHEDNLFATAQEPAKNV
jgi:hypothetical protein